jgi:transcriptional regulator
MNDHEEMVSFMKAYSFATIVTVKDNVPVATHLPFVIAQTDTGIILSAHFALANSQWKQLNNEKTLVIFSEPHAYISPTHYDSEISVPTWNYISVHAYGKSEIITDPAEGIDELEKMIHQYEQDYFLQWNKFPQEVKLKLLRGIVPFRVTVDELQAKKKLSQNKNENERQRIIDTLEKSPHSPEQVIAGYMKKTP